MKRLVYTGPSKSTLGTLAGTQRGPISKMAPISLVEAAFAHGNCARGTNLSPKASLLRKATLAEFSPSPMLPIGPRRVWASSGSVFTAAWWVVSAA